MQNSGFQLDLTSPLVGDASFWINLVATDRLELLLDAFGRRAMIPAMALAELERGRTKGRAAAQVLEALVRGGRIDVVDCHPQDEELYLKLVVGACSETLDDGEAATLVCARRMGGIAVIDERKATSLAATQFPNLKIMSTVDMLLEKKVFEFFGKEEISEAIYRALVGARMQVASARQKEVATLIGPARLMLCQSLPVRLRVMGQ